MSDDGALATAVQQPIDPRLDFFAGTVAGVASLLTGQPFDTIKVRLQSPPTDGRRRYGNAVDALRCILKEEKIAGLYKGVMSPMIGIAAINASVFGCYKLAMTSMLGSEDASPTLGQVCLAGSASGIFTSILTTPIERLKVLQQSSPPTRPQPTLVHLLRARCSTLPSLYRGLTPTLLRDLAYGPYFATYEMVIRWEGAGPEHPLSREGRAGEVEREVREVGTGRVLLAGGAAGIVGWGCTFPVDVVKTRMQATDRLLPAPSSSSTPSRAPVAQLHPHATTLSTFRHSYATEGWRVFVSGLGPTLLRSVPVNMVTFFVFEAVVDAFR